MKYLIKKNYKMINDLKKYKFKCKICYYMIYFSLKFDIML